jgi:hypothetical protein
MGHRVTGHYLGCPEFNEVLYPFNEFWSDGWIVRMHRNNSKDIPHLLKRMLKDRYVRYITTKFLSTVDWDSPRFFCNS